MAVDFPDEKGSLFVSFRRIPGPYWPPSVPLGRLGPPLSPLVSCRKSWTIFVSAQAPLFSCRVFPSQPRSVWRQMVLRGGIRFFERPYRRISFYPYPLGPGQKSGSDSSVPADIELLCLSFCMPCGQAPFLLLQPSKAILLDMI